MSTPLQTRARTGARCADFLGKIVSWSVPAFVASIFFAVSLAPSLVPRPSIVQGVISGISLAVGYGVGTFGGWLWKYLQLPVPGTLWQHRIGLVLSIPGIFICIGFLWKSADWQNTVREIMGMEPEAATGVLLLAFVSGVVFFLLLFVASLFRKVIRVCSSFLHRYLPARVANLLGVLLTLILFWTAIDGVLVRSVLRVANRSFQQLDALMDPEVSPPPQFLENGGQASLVSWQDLGRQGRLFVSSAPSSEELSMFFGRSVQEPIRVYVGVNSAADVHARAELALRELIRRGGFERSLLVLATPTGTGWIDPGAIRSVEYLHRGDIATVAAQYSYLNSPLALLTEADYGAEMAKALFSSIYNYWSSLPQDARPQLYLHGLSLGSFLSELSFSLFEIIDDPFDGALWSGPPFRNRTWRMITAQRDPDSPAWLPVYRGGAVVRFANQHGFAPADTDWGNFRLVFLQYASDPITFFDPSMVWREPAWMKEPRGPDVTPDLQWFPVVTALQVAADMMVGTAPSGFGHEIAPDDYLNSWLALTEPEGWSPEDLKLLRGLLAKPLPAPGTSLNSE